MKKIRVLCFSLILASQASVASAQLVVIGKGHAAQCFEYAKSANQGTRSATETCTEALNQPQTQKDRAATHVNRGILIMRKENYNDAIKDFNAALEINPNLTEAHVNMAAALIYQDKLEPALASINIALQDVDSDTRPAALLNRAVIYDRQEKYVLAYRDLKEAGTLKPNWEKVDQFLSRYTVIQKS